MSAGFSHSNDLRRFHLERFIKHRRKEVNLVENFEDKRVRKARHGLKFVVGHPDGLMAKNGDELIFHGGFTLFQEVYCESLKMCFALFKIGRYNKRKEHNPLKKY